MTEREKLVDSLRSGDERAWRKFINQYSKLIYAIAAKFSFTPAERDDIYQSACLACVRSIGSLRDPNKLSSWLYGVTYRLAIDALRGKRVHHSLDDPHEGTALAERIGEDAGFDEEMERLDEAARLYDGLARLDDRCQRILLATYIEEPRPSYEEISQREQIPVGSIGPTRARCFEKLRKIMIPVSERRPPRSTDQWPTTNDSAEMSS